MHEGFAGCSSHFGELADVIRGGGGGVKSRNEVSRWDKMFIYLFIYQAKIIKYLPYKLQSTF